MRDKDLLKLLKKNGWKLIRITGSHHILQRGEQKEAKAYAVCLSGSVS